MEESNVALSRRRLSGPRPIPPVPKAMVGGHLFPNSTAKVLCRRPRPRPSSAGAAWSRRRTGRRIDEDLSGNGEKTPIARTRWGWLGPAGHASLPEKHAPLPGHASLPENMMKVRASDPPSVVSLSFKAALRASRSKL
jgi:hypothetical protein